VGSGRPGLQVSLTDPDARSKATSGKGTGVVRDNAHVAVGSEHHLIVAHIAKSAMIKPNSSRQAGKTPRYSMGLRRSAFENGVVLAPHGPSRKGGSEPRKPGGMSQTTLADRSPSCQEAICFPP